MVVICCCSLFRALKPSVPRGTSLKKSKKTSANIAVGFKVDNPFVNYGQLSSLGALGRLLVTTLGHRLSIWRPRVDPKHKYGVALASLGRRLGLSGVALDAALASLAAAVASPGAPWALLGVTWAPLGGPSASVGHPGAGNSRILTRSLNPKLV